jgi:hypothetical protein
MLGRLEQKISQRWKEGIRAKASALEEGRSHFMISRDIWAITTLSLRPIESVILVMQGYSPYKQKIRMHTLIICKETLRSW